MLLGLLPDRGLFGRFVLVFGGGGLRFGSSGGGLRFGSGRLFVFLFLVFLFVYAAVRPGHAVSGIHRPRFLHMQVEDLSGRRPERVSLNVPFGLVGGALRFASLGKVRRELDRHFDESIGSAELRSLWEDLEKKPDGGDVVKTVEGATLHFRRDGDSVVIEVSDIRGHETGETVTLRLPHRLVEAIVNSDRDLDVDALISQIKDGGRGELVDVRGRHGHVRITID